MRVPYEYECNACGYVLSHPVDSCPVCSAHFYWMLVPARPLEPNERENYLDRMVGLVSGQTTHQFLTQGNQLWLPHRFWEMNADGSTLDDLDWIAEIKFLQHETGPAQPTSLNTPTDEPESAWDTNPGQDIPDWIRSGPAPSQNPPVENPHPQPEPAYPNAAQPPRMDFAIRPKQQETSRRKGWLPVEGFLPIMIFLFFLLLTLSYFVLLYYKANRRAQINTIPEVATYECQVLSELPRTM